MKNIITVSSSGISDLTLLAVLGRMTMIDEVVGKKDGQCKNVVARHFTGRITITKSSSTQNLIRISYKDSLFIEIL